MVKITNGINIINVSKGAYESIYKNQGFNICKDSKPVETEPEEKVTDSEAELEEKPISKWTKEECIEFVEENNIDISNASNSKEIKEIIKNFIANNEQ